MCSLLREIGFPPHTPTPMFSDNQAAIAIARNPGIPHSRTKHIDIRHHYVRDAVLDGGIRIEWCASEELLADVFTKGLNREMHKKLTHTIQQEKSV